MREIKFRAWDKVFNRMLDRPFVIDQDGRVYFHYDGGGKVKDMLILMQFTGLTDKNGKEIYEGDIIKQEDAIFPIMAIEYDSEIGGWKYSYRNGEYGVSPDRAWEVIGNIYETPELLKEK